VRSPKSLTIPGRGGAIHNIVFKNLVFHMEQSSKQVMPISGAVCHAISYHAMMIVLIVHNVQGLFVPIHFMPRQPFKYTACA
jgi:hypothetical protein